MSDEEKCVCNICSNTFNDSLLNCNNNDNNNDNNDNDKNIIIKNIIIIYEAIIIVIWDIKFN